MRDRKNQGTLDRQEIDGELLALAREPAGDGNRES
jgi:hypothetical protein